MNAIVHDQDLNAWMAQLRTAGDHFGISDEEGDDHYLRKIVDAAAAGINGAAEATVASAATTDVGGTSTIAVVISGTTTITSFGSAANRFRFIRFTGALTLTQNATSLILPGGVDIATTAGDMCFARSDGSGNWRVFAYSPAANAGSVLHTSGTVSAPSMSFAADPDTGFWHSGNGNQIQISLGGTSIGKFRTTGQEIQIAGGGSASLTISGEGLTFSTLQRSSADALSATLALAKSRDTMSAPALVVQNNQIGEMAFNAWTSGSTYSVTGSMRVNVVAATPSATNMEARWTLLLVAAASIVRTEIARFDHATGLSMFGANPVIDQNRHHRLRSYTVAGLPSAATAGMMIYVSNESGGSIPAFSDGTNWRRVTDRAVVS